jgi:hypothetical protein
MGDSKPDHASTRSRAPAVTTEYPRQPGCQGDFGRAPPPNVIEPEERPPPSTIPVMQAGPANRERPRSATVSAHNEVRLKSSPSVSRRSMPFGMRTATQRSSRCVLAPRHRARSTGTYCPLPRRRRMLARPAFEPRSAAALWVILGDPFHERRGDGRGDSESRSAARPACNRAASGAVVRDDGRTGPTSGVTKDS